MPDQERLVVGGVDTHRDFHVAAALDSQGRVLATATFPARREGYRQLGDWLSSFGRVEELGIEGTGAYGAGLCRFLSQAGIATVEVIRPNRQHRRRHGKSDATDAIAAARAVLSGEARGEPRGGTGRVESIRMLKLARRGAMRAKIAAGNQIHALIVTAPEQIRSQLRDLPLAKIVATVARYRPGPLGEDHTQAAKQALKSLAARYRGLEAEIEGLDQELQPLVTAANPTLTELCGVGTQTAADLLIAAGSNPHRIGSDSSFAALCGSSPVDASSGQQQRHRLNRGGDRQANAALYRIVIVRLRYHQPSRYYMERRLKEGLTKKEIVRCLKRYVAREVYQILNQPVP